MQKSTTHIYCSFNKFVHEQSSTDIFTKTYNYSPHTKLTDACTLADTVAYTLKRKSANR